MPLDCLDYVIMHELCHCKIKGHGPRFWKFFEGFLPAAGAATTTETTTTTEQRGRRRTQHTHIDDGGGPRSPALLWMSEQARSRIDFGLTRGPAASTSKLGVKRRAVNNALPCGRSNN